MTKGEQTHKSLEMALYRIEKGRTRIIQATRRLSIAAVAEEAGVSTATIHNRYPDIADQIRKLLEKETRKQRDRKQQDLKDERSKSRKLREELSELRKEKAKLLSVNATLMAENAHLKAIVNAKNVTVFDKNEGG